MRSTVKTFILAGIITLAIPSLANARGFENTLTEPLTTPVKIEVVLSEEMQHRANNLPTKLRDRNIGSTRGLRKGFSGNGHYGEKDLKVIVGSLEKKMVQKFTKKGIPISDDAPVTMRITIEEAKNNRPTFNQLSVEPSLSFQSFGLGGASMSADFITDTGELLGTMSYSYYETNLFNRNTSLGPIWYDADRSFRFFASKSAKALAN